MRTQLLLVHLGNFTLTVVEWLTVICDNVASMWACDSYDYMAIGIWAMEQAEIRFGWENVLLDPHFLTDVRHSHSAGADFK